ncbi:MAG: HAMP domain-containing histidine kinase [Phaeodactylibacter sp.]|nr:HAMP domain-containing histidine kinase [Phaeodactylibacter sp.]
MLMHDLRTPIKSISLIADMLDMQEADPETTGLLREAGSQASEIFDDFLDYLRETPLEKQPVDLNLVLKQAIKMCENRTPNHGVAIAINAPEQLEILGDGSKLKRSFINLIGNAIDALTSRTIDHPAIQIKIESEAEQLNISIADNDPGLPEDILPKLFEPFVTKNKSAGTGLGLAIVKQYIESHGGQISAHNDQGAIFTIKLPTA